MTARHPTKRLFDPNPDTRLQYVHSSRSDIRLGFARLMLHQAQQEPDSLAPLLIASIELARAKKAQK